MSLVTKSATTTAVPVPQNNRRSAALSIFLFGLALDAEAGVGERVEAIEADGLAALLAQTEALGGAVEAAQRLVHVPQVAPFLRGKEERLLPLHRLGALIGHVERVPPQAALRSPSPPVQSLPHSPQLPNPPPPPFP